jgi:hypothetical protein
MGVAEPGKKSRGPFGIVVADQKPQGTPAASRAWQHYQPQLFDVVLRCPLRLADK